MALQEANKFLSEIVASQVEVAEPSNDQDLSTKSDESKVNEQLAQPDNSVTAVGSTTEVIKDLSRDGSTFTEKSNAQQELDQKPTVNQDSSLRHAELVTGDSFEPTTDHTIPSSDESFPDLNSDTPKLVRDNVARLPPAELRNKQANFHFPDLTSTTKPTALIVDDNVVNLRVMQMYCSKRNLPHICAKDGLEAISLFRSHQEYAVKERTKPPIQLILMDLQMPNCDGIEATRQIRQLEEKNGWGSSVLFVITGQDSAADRKAVSEAGGQEYYVKPVSIKSLDAGLKGYFPNFKSSGA